MSEAERAPEGEVLSVHFGHSANCSSIGSFVDFLFVSAVVGSALIGAVAAGLRESAPAPSTPVAEEDERGGRDDPEPRA